MEYELRQNIQDRELQMTQEAQAKREEELNKNHDFFMVFNRTGTNALRAVARKSGQAMDLFLWLAESMDSRGAIAVTNKTLSETLNIAPSHISRSLGILRSMGVIFTLPGGGLSIHCINPEIAWKSTETGKKYALFYARVIVSAEDMEKCQAEAHAKQRAASDSMIRSVRAKVLVPKKQRDLPPRVGDGPSQEINFNPE